METPAPSADPAEGTGGWRGAMALGTPKVALVLDAGKGTQGDAESQVRLEACAWGVTSQWRGAPWQGFRCLEVFTSGLDTFLGTSGYWANWDTGRCLGLRAW